MKKAYLLITLIFTIVNSFTLSAQKESVDIIKFYGDAKNHSLPELIADTYSKNKVPIIYFYADWCGPCHSFKKNLKHKLLIEALKNATLIKVNIDIDTQGLVSKYLIRAVPTFVKVDENGVVKAKITSSKWGKSTAKNTAPVMKELIDTDTFDN